jgi:periplasmic copper chaperone A
MKFAGDMKSLLSGSLAALALSGFASAAPQIAVTDAWIRALPGKLPAGGYFTLHNGTAKTLTLKGAASSACGSLMLHKSDTMGGMASMSDVATIDVPAGGTLTFAPGGLHLMCMDPRPQLQRGAEVTVTLQFQGGAQLPVRFHVRGANGR